MKTKTENHDVMDQAHVFDLAAESSKLSIRLSMLCEYQQSMEVFVGSCEANGYTFLESGKMANR